MNNVKEQNTFSKNAFVFWSLTRRHLKVFFKNYLTVIFTLMVPLCILLVYIVFLRQMEVKELWKALASKGVTLGTGKDAEIFKRHVEGIADCWMISGTLALSCITVSLNANYIVVRDKESGIARDMISSPISPNIITSSYFVFNAIVTFLINFIVYIICIICLFIYGAYMITFVEFLAILGVLLLSVISASLITFFCLSFIKTESVMSPVIAIFCAAGGFLIGSYLPPNMLPDVINNITLFFPGTYSSSLLRNFFLHTPLEKLMSDIQVMYPGKDKVIESYINDAFPQTLDFFGSEVQTGTMALVIFAFIGIFAVLNLLFSGNNILNLSIKKNKAQKKTEITTNNTNND
jgi:multidrug/hemolysin transport system permease protein